MSQKKVVEGFVHDVPVSRLLDIRGKSMRRGVWFKVLDRAERAIINLTVRCVDSIKSRKLAKIVKAIVVKLSEALKGQVERLMETVGRPLAKNLSRIAQAWGNKSAKKWAVEKPFIKYLTIMDMNNLPMFRAN